MASMDTLFLLAALGGGLILVHFLLRRRRRYLIYAGLLLPGFGSIGTVAAAWRPWLLAVLVAVIALLVYEAVRETGDRIQRLHEEQRDREAAFGELMGVLARRHAASAGVSSGNRGQAAPGNCENPTSGMPRPAR